MPDRLGRPAHSYRGYRRNTWRLNLEGNESGWDKFSAQYQTAWHKPVVVSSESSVVTLSPAAMQRKQRQWRREASQKPGAHGHMPGFRETG